MQDAELEEYALRPYGSSGPTYLVGRRAYRAYVFLSVIGGTLLLAAGVFGILIYPIHSPVFVAILAVAFAVFVWGRHRIASSGRAVDELPVGHAYKTLNFRRWPSTNFWLFEISTLVMISFLLYFMLSEIQRGKAIDVWVWVIPIALAAAMAFGVWKQVSLSRAQDTVEPRLFFWPAQIGLWLVLALELLALWVVATRHEGIGTLPTILTVATAYSIFYSIGQWRRRRRGL